MHFLKYFHTALKIPFIYRVKYNIIQSMKRKFKKRLSIIIFIFILLTVLLISSCENKSRKITIPKSQYGLEVDGDKVLMHKYLEGPLLMLIQGSALDYVTSEQLKIAGKIHEKYSSKGLQMLFLSSGDMTGERVRVLKTSGPYMFGFFIEDENFSRLFGKQDILPSIRLIDSKGNVLRQYKNYTDEKTLTAEVERLLTKIKK